MAVLVPIISVIAAVASTAVGIYSAVSGGKDESSAQKDLARQTRLQAQQRAEDEAKQHRRILATQRAKYGASGLSMEGTPLLVQAESLAEGEEQLRRIYENAENVATAHEEAGDQTLRSGYVSALQAGVKGAGNIYNQGVQNKWWGTA